MTPRTTVGQLNGWWSVLLKIVLASYPVVLSAHIAGGAYLFRTTTVNRVLIEQHVQRDSHDGAVRKPEFERLYSQIDKLSDKIDQMVQQRRQQ